MKRFLKFGTVGVFNTLITLGSYMLFIYIGVHYLLANVLGYVLGVLNSYYWNKKWVFDAGEAKRDVFLKFALVNIFTLGFNTLILYLLVHLGGVHPVLANIVAIVSGFVLNYLLNARWTFAAKGQPLK
ncbi:GtrA family protein [Bacillus sp. es.034]|uniref:GtrA family protein n=1 Tax=Bacillus sp. es.034 TaxID=1761763 RepID=UPI000BF3D641|nr:GtrA family protein [Bacillus sp. es.034]PFG04565.1 putative flippase GtrA [Bacillus sp. es.034]